MAKKTKSAGNARKTTKGAKAPKAAAAKATPAKAAKPRDPRLPAAGETIVRPYKGKDYRVTVLEDGFRYDGKEYRSLSALASEISGAESINGFLWFGLVKRPAKPAAKRAQKDPPAESSADAA